MQPFDKLWNYNNPAETEQIFLSLLQDSSPEKDLSYHLQLLTQIARTHSLRRQFEKAHELLNEVKTQLPEAPGVPQVRYHLERGRTFNSAGEKEKAMAEFHEAGKTAEALGEDFYRIDALHMLAIACPPAESKAWNEKAIVAAEASADERAKGWLGSLYNNLGWAYFDSGEFEKALSIFLRALQWRESKRQAYETFLAKWCVARTLRALNRLDEAIKIQTGLMEEMIESSKPDGYVYEELAELHLLKGEELHKMYFQLAYNELKEDSWFAQNEAARLQRMKDLSA